ncbi:conodipine-P1-like isoform X3 [Clytia hemisphaerica]|uniref:Conodipine-M alpha chain n=1 Tax=Clytia hemisphaerica TaxID=252671 RepID=A0A7M5X3Q8_9CNID
MLFLIACIAAYVNFSVALDNSTCPIVKKTNGCSIPLDLSFPYKEVFKDVCNMHDVCYVCGKTNNWTRAECDLAFLKDLRNYCNTTTQFADSHVTFQKDKLRSILQNAVKKAGLTSQDGIDLKKEAFEIFMMVVAWRYIQDKHIACLHGANIYYKAVNAFGASSYAKRPKPICTHACAKKLGHPY